jgi:hypothetical protein
LGLAGGEPIERPCAGSIVLIHRKNRFGTSASMDDVFTAMTGGGPFSDPIPVCLQERLFIARRGDGATEVRCDRGHEFGHTK